MATTETWKDRTSGERKEKTEWHRVVLFGNLAEIARDYLKKGALALFEGPIRTRKWQDNNGQDQYTTEIHAETLKMLGQKSGESASNQAPITHRLHLLTAIWKITMIGTMTVRFRKR